MTRTYESMRLQMSQGEQRPRVLQPNKALIPRVSAWTQAGNRR